MLLTGEIVNYFYMETYFIAKSLVFHFFTELDFYPIKI